MHVRSYGGDVANPEVIAAKSFSLDSAIRHLRDVSDTGRYDDDASSINLPSDDVVLHAAEHFAKHFASPQLRHIFLVGIGGSNLGTKAVLDALFAWKQPSVAVHMVDTVHGERLEHLRTLIMSLSSLDECLLISISKSGGTTETIANTEILLSILKERDSESYTERAVIISDNGSPYSKVAEELHIACIAMPPKVGGRYSVFSAVGMFPLALSGVDIASMRRGASDMLRTCLNFDSAMNPAVMTAVLQYEAYKAGYTNHTLFAFSDELESLGKWWRQLVGESLAKTTRTTKEKVGVIPTVSIGSTDLHSVGQVYLGGPKTTLTSFLSVTAENNVTIPTSTKRLFPDIVPIVGGVRTHDIGAAILGGTKRSYEKAQLPYIEIVLPEISAYEIGAFMQYAMCSTIYAAELFDVCAFDQPEVELYKIETKHILETSLQK